MPSLALKASINYPIIGGSSESPYDPDAFAWFNAVEATGANFGASPASITSNKEAFNTAFLSLKSAGIWNAIRQACFLVGPSTFAGALVNIKLTGNPTNSNFVSGDYNRLTGLKGNGLNKYLNTNISDASTDPWDLHLYTKLTDEGSVSADTNQFVLGSNYSNTRAIMCWYSSEFGPIEFQYVIGRNNSNYLAGTFVPFTEGKIGFNCLAGDVTYWNFDGWQPNYSGTPDDLFDANNYHLFRAPNISVTNFNGRSAFYSIGSSIDLPALDGIVETLRVALIN
jgi:hypothetical protein